MTHHFEFDNDHLDDMVYEWHENHRDTTSLEDFVRNVTGWTGFQYDLWVITGRNPDA